MTYLVRPYIEGNFCFQTPQSYGATLLFYGIAFADSLKKYTRLLQNTYKLVQLNRKDLLIWGLPTLGNSVIMGVLNSLLCANHK
jgi:hypothetical protein